MNQHYSPRGVYSGTLNMGAEKWTAWMAAQPRLCPPIPCIPCDDPMRAVRAANPVDGKKHSGSFGSRLDVQARDVVQNAVNELTSIRNSLGFGSRFGARLLPVINSLGELLK